MVGIHVSNKISFSGLEEIPKSQVIASVLPLKKSELDANIITKDFIKGIKFEFFIRKATYFATAGSMAAFEDILDLLVYGFVMFPNIDNFVDVNSIRIFLIRNPTPTLLGDTYHSIHLSTGKRNGTIACCVTLLYMWFISHLRKTPTFRDNKECFRWSQRIMSLISSDIVWYSRDYFYT